MSAFGHFFLTLFNNFQHLYGLNSHSYSYINYVNMLPRDAANMFILLIYTQVLIYIYIYIFGTNTRNRERPRTYSKLWSV